VTHLKTAESTVNRQDMRSY